MPALIGKKLRRSIVVCVSKFNSLHLGNTVEFSEEKLQQRLKALKLDRQTAFAAACCERLLPNNEAFCSIEGGGNFDLLANALQTVWNGAQGVLGAETDVSDIIDQVGSLRPDLDDYTSLYATLALDAIAAVMSALECLRDYAISEVTSPAVYAVQSMDSYLSAVNDPILEVHAGNSEFDKLMWQSPLMQQELAKQEEDLRLLEICPEITLEIIDELKRSSSQTGINPRLRGLVRTHAT